MFGIIHFLAGGVLRHMGDSSTPFGNGNVTDSDRIAYIREVLAELRTVSAGIGRNDVLTYFIEMAMMEAADKQREILRRK